MRLLPLEILTAKAMPAHQRTPMVISSLEVADEAAEGEAKAEAVLTDLNEAEEEAATEVVIKVATLLHPTLLLLLKGKHHQTTPTTLLLKAKRLDLLQQPPHLQQSLEKQQNLMGLASAGNEKTIETLL